MEISKRLAEIQQLLGNYSSSIPNPTKNYTDLIESVMSTGVIPVKYKELIFIALSLAQRCDWCLAYHLRLAMENDVTEDEMNEAAFLALLMAGTPALMESIKMKQYLQELKQDH
jgi:AhpD family alkylhydroperoxidase